MTIPASTVTNAAVSSDAAIARSKLAQDALKPFMVNLTDFRIWDAFQTALPGTSSGDDLALVGGTFGTAPPSLRTADLKAAGSTTLRARALIQLPAEYDAGQTILIRISAGMITTIADVAATIDVEAYKSSKANGIGSDLCATAAQNMNSVTFANFDFTITPTGLAAGDLLDVRLSMLVNDAATATAVIGCIGGVDLLCDVKG